MVLKEPVGAGPSRAQCVMLITCETIKFRAAIQLTPLFDQRMIPRLATRRVIRVVGIIRGVAQHGSATALGAVGREFESLHPDQI